MAPDMTARFVARARVAGIPLAMRADTRNDSSRARSFLLKPLVVPGFVAAVLSIVMFSLGVFYSHLRLTTRTKEAPPTASIPIGTSAASSGEERELKEELLRTRQQVAALSAQVKQQQLTLDSVRAAKNQLAQQLAQLTPINETRSTEVANLKEQLEKVSAQENADRAELLDAQAGLRTKELRVSDLEAELAAAKQLNEMLGEARELIIARNLHVKDIPSEVDGNGNPGKAFARVFYAEGRRLDFYAYDLADLRGPSQRRSFYVWREASGPKEQITKLGQLQIDNEKDGRWVLRVSDPNLLTHLNSVFVTLESGTKAVIQPTGKRMLFAFLGNHPNHP